MSSESGIRVGIDLGSTTCRVAYVFPEEAAVVPVPLTMDQFQPVFPIADRIPINEMYISNFFPGVVQRLQPGFSITFAGQPRDIGQILALILGRVVDAAAAFTGSEVDSLLVTHPVWVDEDGRRLIQEAIAETGKPGALCTDVEAACTHFRVDRLEEDEHATVLVLSAGYAGSGMALMRSTPKGVRALAGAGHQALLSGNMVDFAILQSTMFALRDAQVMFSDVRSATVWSAFQFNAEKAKQALREEDGVTLEVPRELTPDQVEPVKAWVSGPVFRDFVLQHLEQALAMMKGVLAEANVVEEDVDYVLLEGGSTHLPGIAAGLRKAFPKAEVHHLPPDAVAGGAAWTIHQRPLAELVGEPPITCPSPPDFFPRPFAVDGLVTLPDLASAHPVNQPAEALAEIRLETPGVADATSVADHPRAEGDELPPVDAMALRAIRELAEGGDADAALRCLYRLRDAVREEIDRLS
ncbi:Hsp70 family protein [Gemmatimonadota bacterium]